MTATPAWGFPWLDHFTWREANAVERLRKTTPDHLVHTLKAATFMDISKSDVEILQYLQRNPRRPEEAA